MIGVIFMAMVIAVVMTIPAFAGECIDQKRERLRQWEEALNRREAAQDNMQRHLNDRSEDEDVRSRQNDEERRLIREERAALEAEKRQMYAAAPPAGEYVPVPQTVATPFPMPVPVPVWGWGYYRFWDDGNGDWASTRIWRQDGWCPPSGYYPIGADEYDHHRHFADGRVDGNRLMFNQGQRGHHRMDSGRLGRGDQRGFNGNHDRHAQRGYQHNYRNNSQYTPNRGGNNFPGMRQGASNFPRTQAVRPMSHPRTGYSSANQRAPYGPATSRPQTYQRVTQGAWRR